MVLLISYDLNNHERPSAYEDVANMIKSKATDYKKPLASQWLVQTNDTPDTWSGWMKTVTDEDDNWLIVQVRQPYAGWLPKSIWPWLRERV